MLISEAKDYLTGLGYKILKEETEMSEQDFMDKIRNKIIEMANKINYKIDDKELDTIIFEAYDRGWDIDTAVKQVWKAVYVEEGADLVIEEE